MVFGEHCLVSCLQYRVYIPTAAARRFIYSSMLPTVELALELSFPFSTAKLHMQMPNCKSQSHNGVSSLCREGQPKEPLDSYHAMDYPTIPFDSDGYASLLQAATNLKAPSDGKQIHAHILKNGFDQNVFLGTKLVSMYAKCESLNDARLVFDKLHKRNIFLWNAMIRAYAWNGPCEEALTLYSEMQLAGVKPDNFTFSVVLKACAGLSALQEGKVIQYHAIRSGFESDIAVGTALIDMYAKCGRIDVARQLFDKMSNRNVVSWSAIITGCTQNGHAEEALKLFCQMQLAEVVPNAITMVCVLQACGLSAALEQGKEIHAYVTRNGFASDISVGNSLVAMYAKCGRIHAARLLFDKMSTRDVVSWNAMVAGYAQNGHANEAVALFHQMQLANVKPDPVTMVSVLSACASLTALQQGKWVHDYIVRSGFELDAYVGTALIDMYSKCRNMEIACQLFDKMSKRDVVLWNAMIAGYVLNGRADEALAFFHQMQLANVNANSGTLVSVLPACAHLASLQQGKSIHAYIIRSSFESDVSVGNSLVAMYAKCGSIHIARQLFDTMSKRDVVSWSVMIAGYGTHGHGNDALALFSQMQQTSVKPDHITFVCVLSACSHAGLVDKGWQYFDCMSQDYCITPRVEHYACMVDLLGRAGHLDDALDFIKNMPLEPDAGVWGAMLGACRIHCNTGLGEYVSDRLFELEPNNIGNYILLSNIYAEAGRWDDVGKVRVMLKDQGLKKSPGCSWIEIKNQIHVFLAGDRSHPQSEEIHEMLEGLAGQMIDAGYVPDTSFVLHEVQDEKECIL